MKKAIILALLCMLCPAFALAADEFAAPVTLNEIGVTAAFPMGWTVVTPETAQAHPLYFPGTAPEDIADNLRAEGVYAIAFSPAGDAALRVIASEGDAVQALYFDIDRYTAAMRSEIRSDFLNKAAWALTGYRYSEAEWTNRSAQGRMLWLVYTVRFEEETVARGRQAYTIRNGLAFTLDLQVTARTVTAAEQKLFESFVSGVTLPVSHDMPLMPVGLTLTAPLPEETYNADIAVRGTTTKGAIVSAWIKRDNGDPVLAGEAKANASGVFRVDVALPDSGDWWIALNASLEGHADSTASGWVNYNPTRIPVNFTQLPTGDVDDAKIVISGKTISGVTIQCMEGSTNVKKTTGSDGSFSFTLDRAIVGQRTVVLSMDKKGFVNRRVDITFNRVWKMDDYFKYLAEKVQSLSYQNLHDSAAKYLGRLVRYTGQIISVSESGGITYVHLALTVDKNGKWSDGIIAEWSGGDVALSEGDRATLYVEVTAQTYGFTDTTNEGDAVRLTLPSVKLLAYQKEN